VCFLLKYLASEGGSDVMKHLSRELAGILTLEYVFSSSDFLVARNRESMSAICNTIKIPNNIPRSLDNLRVKEILMLFASGTEICICC